MLLTALINICLWIFKQAWFQKAMIKLVTSIADGTSNKVDDKIVCLIKAFIREHKRNLIDITAIEAKKKESHIDDRLVKSLDLV